MPVETIGELGTPGASREWISAQAMLAIRFITKNCGSPPPEMELEVQWQEHELGSLSDYRSALGRRNARSTVELSREVSGGAYGSREWRSTSSRLVNAASLFRRRRLG